MKAFMMGLLLFAAVYAALVCIAVVISVLGRTVTGLIVSAVVASGGFVAPQALWNWPEAGALGFALLVGLACGGLTYFLMSTPAQRRELLFGSGLLSKR